MPVFNRKELPTLLQHTTKEQTAQFYVVFGERFLCQQIAGELLNALLPDEKERQQSLIAIDGDQENPLETLNLLRTYSLFGGKRVIKVSDSKLFFSKSIAKSLWDKALQAFQEKKETAVGRYLGQFLALFPAADEAGSPLEELVTLSTSSWQEIFGFAKPQNLDWLKELPSPAVPSGKKKGDPAQQYFDVLEQGLPQGHILLLLSETVDKRTRLFTYAKKNGIVIDASVDSGASKAARQDQQGVIAALIDDTLAKFGKNIAANVRQALLERVGFQPVAAVMETEKLALFAGDAVRITAEHLEAISCRSKEDALFELTEAIAAMRFDHSFLLLKRLQEGGMHPLAIVAGLRNFFRKLLLARSLQDGTRGFTGDTSYPSFQKNFLPLLQEQFKKDMAALPTHPYALFNLFKQASSFRPSKLRAMLSFLLDAEFRMKSSPLAAATILDFLLGQIFFERSEVPTN